MSQRDEKLRNLKIHEKKGSSNVDIKRIKVTNLTTFLSKLTESIHEFSARHGAEYFISEE